MSTTALARGNAEGGFAGVWESCGVLPEDLKDVGFTTRAV